MLRIKTRKRMLWGVAAIAFLPDFWILQIEVTYEHNIRRGIPADFHLRRPHVVQMWKA
jgi:hypothetical protein